MYPKSHKAKMDLQILPPLYDWKSKQILMFVSNPPLQSAEQYNAKSLKGSEVDSGPPSEDGGLERSDLLPSSDGRVHSRRKPSESKH